MCHKANKPTQMSSILIGCLIHMALCHVQAKNGILLNVVWRKQQAGNIHECKNEINNF